MVQYIVTISLIAHVSSSSFHAVLAAVTRYVSAMTCPGFTSQTAGLFSPPEGAQDGVASTMRQFKPGMNPDRPNPTSIQRPKSLTNPELNRRPHAHVVQVISVLEIPGIGDQAAKTLCDEMKIRSQGDKKLEEAKKILYLRGFNEGVMVVGAHKGKKVTTHTVCLLPGEWPGLDLVSFLYDVGAFSSSMFHESRNDVIAGFGYSLESC